MCSWQAQARLETKHLEQFVVQSPNLKSIGFDGYFNLDIANEYLYKIIKDRTIFVIFSRNLKKKSIRNELAIKQNSLEEFLLQDPLVHAKYQTMKRQNLILSENNMTLDTDKTNLSTPKSTNTLLYTSNTSNSLATRRENPSIRTVVITFLGFLVLVLLISSACIDI